MLRSEVGKHSEIAPTPQEELLLKLSAGAFEAATSQIQTRLEKGLSPSVLSILRTDLLIGFAQSWRNVETNHTEQTNTYKDGLFRSALEKAQDEDPASIESLPKFATNLGQLAIAMELVLDNKGSIAEWHAERPYIQYLGTFDPQQSATV